MNIAEYLRGSWRVERVIDDTNTGQITHFDGSATFETSSDGLSYREEGVHNTGAHSLIAERRYRYVISEDGPAEVLFEDGRPFHSLVLTHEPWRVTHMCVNDEYHGTFMLIDETSWQAEWEVHGPQKSYASATTYRRMSDGTLQ